MKYLKLLLLVAIIFTSCKGKEKADKNAEESSVETTLQKVPAVCIIDKVSIREEPHSKGKWISRLSLGEKVIFLGKSQVDTTNESKTEYHFIELSDGKQGWAYGKGVLLNSKPGAIVGKTPIYTRPDLVTKTSKSFNIMDFVAIVGEKDNWVEVVGAGLKKKGWVNSKKITAKTEDVAIATLGYKTLYNAEGEIDVAKIADFLEDLPYESSQFKSYLQNLLDSKVGEAVEQSVEEYEEEEIDS